MNKKSTLLLALFLNTAFHGMCMDFRGVKIPQSLAIRAASKELHWLITADSESQPEMLVILNDRIKQMPQDMEGMPELICIYGVGLLRSRNGFERN